MKKALLLMIKKKLKKLGMPTDISLFEKINLTELDVASYDKGIGPDAKEPGSLTAPKEFNLMFQTYVGATQSEENISRT